MVVNKYLTLGLASICLNLNIGLQLLFTTHMHFWTHEQWVQEPTLPKAYLSTCLQQTWFWRAPLLPQICFSIYIYFEICIGLYVISTYIRCCPYQKSLHVSEQQRVRTIGSYRPVPSRMEDVSYLFGYWTLLSDSERLKLHSHTQKILGTLTSWL